MGKQIIKYSVISLGCKVNSYEAAYIINQLNKEGYTYVENDFADIYVVFSCCVTNMAELKTRKEINKLRRINPNAFICVVGCYPQTKPDSPIFDEVDLVIGTKNKTDIPNLIKESYKGKIIEKNNNLTFESMFIDSFPNKSRAFVKIQDGCNQYCSYCIIPYARGNERSESHTKILKIVNELSKKYKEIVLTGIHTGKYNDNGYNLYNLLCDLVKIKNIETIRLSSIELNEISDDIIELMASNSKLAPHLHIPVQSLNNDILKNMNRPYTIEDFKDRLRFIKNKVKNISISTDLIVGFPGETTEIFNSYFKQLDEIEFSFIHVFPYSKKDGTKAACFDNQIINKVKKERVNKVINYQKNITYKYKSSFVGSTLEVLNEKNINEYSYGYTKNYIYTQIKGNKEIGSINKVKIIDIKDNIIIGEYVS